MYLLVFPLHYLLRMFGVGFVASQSSPISYPRFLSVAAVSNEGKTAKFSSAAKPNI